MVLLSLDLSPRQTLSSLVTLVYSTLLPVGVLLPVLTSPFSHTHRRTTALTFLAVSAVTHLTWEFGFLLNSAEIKRARDSTWAFVWWAYVEGGDRRYVAEGQEFVLIVAMEVLSVANGVVGAVSIWRHLRDRSSLAPLLALFAMSVVHFYSCSLYYISEILAGLPNVDHTVMGVLFKFILANSPWVLTPPIVWMWVYDELGSAQKQKKK
jgi:hypothetical protein